MKTLKRHQNTRMIEATFSPCTDTRGSRVKIFERPRNNGDRQKTKIIPYDHELDGVQEQAQAALERSGFNIVAISSWRDSYVFLVDNWGKEYLEVSDIK
jgi:hypothetical protein